MTLLLIVEANTPDLVAKGHAGATGFVDTTKALAPDISMRVINPYDRPSRIGDLDDVSGVIFTGSGVAWSADASEAAPQQAAFDLALTTGLPIWGSCNGLQLAAVLLGGATGDNPKGIEVGIAQDIRLTSDGHTHPMMQGRQDGFTAPCIHRDHVTKLPTRATLLAGNAHSPVQAMMFDAAGVDFWGTQYHPEASSADIAAYVKDQGIFAHLHAMADDLERAEQDEEAAARLGSDCASLSLARRSREFANWLAHVKQCAAH